MKNYKALSIILLGLILGSCGDSKKNASSYFSFNTSDFKSHYQSNDTVTLEVTNLQNKTIDSIIYYVNEVKIDAKKGNEKATFDLKNKKLGYQNLKALVYFEGDSVAISDRIELVSDISPKLLSYKIVNTYPHDTTSYTEGLEFYRDTLYESGGSYNKSKFFKYDYKTGKVYKQLNVDGKYFGEGLTIINNKLYLLTYKEKTGFIYNADTWELEKTFTFDKDIEGWGMTNDGTNIYQSDGTEKIWTMNPDTQKMTDYINVYTNVSKIKSVNELEWIDGKIYGNIFTKDAIAVIDPKTGSVEAVIDLSALKSQIKNKEADVLNGIAYNPKTKTIFITGKNWDKMFEIKVLE